MHTTPKVAIALGALLVVAYVAFSGVIFVRDDGGTSNARYVPDAPQPSQASAAPANDGGGAADPAMDAVPALPAIPPGMTFGEAEALLSRFGDALELLDRNPGTVLDTSRLPTSKVRLRAAMLTYLKTSKDPSALDFFRGTYPRLAFFQDGIGETPVALDSPAPDGRTWSGVIGLEQRALMAELVARANR